MVLSVWWIDGAATSVIMQGAKGHIDPVLAAAASVDDVDTAVASSAAGFRTCSPRPAMNELDQLRPEPVDEPTSPQPRRRRREGRKQRSRGRRALRWALIGLVVVILAVAGGAWWMVNHVSSSIERIPGAFDIPEDQRPPAAEDGSLNLLLAGLDGEDSADDFERGAARTDAIMIVHFNAGRDRVYLVSLGFAPHHVGRDLSRVPIPIQIVQSAARWSS
jgi:hypothetical protein